MNIEQLIILVLTVAAAGGATAAAVAYIKLAPWWESWIGRMYLALLVVLAALLWLLVINRALNGDVTRTAWIFLALMLAVTLWGNFFTIIHTQRQANPEEDEP
ncbi:hypothetical protein [Paenarthrobacter sp. YJN-5]|uniref:putative phage holin n=1 Tax=Paenarthrobacter sp. YJN-5 TaxID=2735316 RepID=UPI0018777B7C|nr:hypothetical protein [Paenarthrobacter sp. YJN-5]QOT19745.1 hypothetical protein HMI59_24095 [Paenarthrobacter sp. YJN-5]